MRNRKLPTTKPRQLGILRSILFLFSISYKDGQRIRSYHKTDVPIGFTIRFHSCESRGFFETHVTSPKKNEEGDVPYIAFHNIFLVYLSIRCDYVVHNYRTNSHNEHIVCRFITFVDSSRAFEPYFLLFTTRYVQGTFRTAISAVASKTKIFFPTLMSQLAINTVDVYDVVTKNWVSLVAFSV
jgi:hypothetical protein